MRKLKKPDHITANSAGSEWVQIVSALRRPFLSEHGHQAHRSKASVAVPVQVANDAFLGKSDSEVSPVRPFIVKEYKEFDAMRRQIIETNLQDRSQQARPNPAPGMSYRYPFLSKGLNPDAEKIGRVRSVFGNALRSQKGKTLQTVTEGPTVRWELINKD